MTVVVATVVVVAVVWWSRLRALGRQVGPIDGYTDDPHHTTPPTLAPTSFPT